MGRISRILSNPDELIYRALGRARPELLWSILGARSRRNRLARPRLILSFDCDTTEDSRAVLSLDAELRALGLVSAYAVPGELLLESQSVYAKLRDRGAEFLNHGYRRHTVWNAAKGHNESTFFYDQVDLETVKADIVQGHEALGHFLGRAPLGFRAPHFGTFQDRRQLRFLYDLLRSLGYRYSSSTLPCSGFRSGSVFDVGRLREVPVTGAFSEPMRPFDSWGYFQSPDGRRSGDDFLAETRRMAEFCDRTGFSGYLNYYADPSHVAGDPRFLESVRALLAVADASTLSAAAEGTI